MDVLQKAFRQYESAMGSAAATGDRLCQMEAMDGAARCLEALRLQHKICNCRPLEFNTRLLEVAGSVGAKVNCQYRSRIVMHVRSIYFMWNRERERYKGGEEKEKRIREERCIVKSISLPRCENLRVFIFSFVLWDRNSKEVQ